MLNCDFKVANRLFTMPLNSTQKIIIILWLLFLLILSPLVFFTSLYLKTSILEWEIFSINSLHISIPIILDPVGLLFSLVVIFISANIIQFSIFYIKEDPFIKRFSHIVILFVLSINLLIFIPHIIALLLGWDGLGITSFVLVIYYQNPKSLAAGIITALTNRIGDVIILLSIAWSLNQGHWFIINIWSSHITPYIIVAIIIAALTKRAQIPFSRWLPAAIAAPTPVSALVHSSTLVTAGIFLLIRFYPLLRIINNFKLFILLTARITILIAGISAITECDIKKIIALSTLRQLGVIIFSLSLGHPNLALFHLITHAIFKALLFMCAGTLIITQRHSQDLRYIGILNKQTPLILSYIIVANIALCGRPFLSGFYSKDLIIETASFNPINPIVIIIVIIATILTTSYSLRFLLTIIWSPHLSAPLHLSNDTNYNSSVPCIFLSLGAIFIGTLLNWTIILPVQEPILNLSQKTMPLTLILLGILLAILRLKKSNQNSTLHKRKLFHHICSLIWFLTPLSSQFQIKIILPLTHLYLKIIDQGWNELVGGQGRSLTSKTLSNIVLKWQNNIITAQLTLSLFILLPIILYICLNNLMKI